MVGPRTARTSPAIGWAANRFGSANSIVEIDMTDVTLSPSALQAVIAQAVAEALKAPDDAKSAC